MHLRSFLFAGYFVILSNVALIVLGQYFTLVLLNCLCVFFIHLNLELLTQFPASNE